MAVLQTGQSFSSGDQVTATKLQDIANLATFRTGTNQTADDSTIQVDGSGGYLKVKSAGISSNELATDSVITAKIQDGAVTAAKLDSAAVSVLMPSGTVLPYAGSALPGNPNDYLFCNGAAVSRSTYSNLFTAIGTDYGVGDGSTTFNIPDLRGRVIAGQDDMGGTSANVLTDSQADQLGGTLGAEDHTLTVNEMPSHTHGLIIDSGSEDDFGTSGGNTNNVSSGSGDTNATGGGSAHNNVQPTIILNYIIKT
jgi:microcystin-dependent protein